MLFLDTILLYIREFIAGVGVAVILLGAMWSAYQLIMLLLYRTFSVNDVRLQFGKCIILGLEFMVGADIVESLVQPDYHNLGLLAILVVIRTVLSYFLSVEISELSPKKEESVSPGDAS